MNSKSDKSYSEAQRLPGMIPLFGKKEEKRMKIKTEKKEKKSLRITRKKKRKKNLGRVIEFAIYPRRTVKRWWGKRPRRILITPTFTFPLLQVLHLLNPELAGRFLMRFALTANVKFSTAKVSVILFQGVEMDFYKASWGGEGGVRAIALPPWGERVVYNFS